MNHKEYFAFQVTCAVETNNLAILRKLLLDSWMDFSAESRRKCLEKVRNQSHQSLMGIAVTKEYWKIVDYLHPYVVERPYTFSYNCIEACWVLDGKLASLVGEYGPVIAEEDISPLVVDSSESRLRRRWERLLKIAHTLSQTP